MKKKNLKKIKKKKKKKKKKEIKKKKNILKKIYRCPKSVGDAKHTLENSSGPQIREMAIRQLC